MRESWSQIPAFTGLDPVRARHRLRGFGWPALLLAAALLVPIVQLIVGVAMDGPNRADDGNFAVFTLVQFQREWGLGHIPPGWSPLAFGQLGSPIFMFYPPGAYLATGLLGFALPGLPAATIVGLAQIMFRAGAMMTGFLWLRRLTTPQAALAGSALYALMPWVSMTNPQIRLAFAECAASALVPLAFLAVDLGRGRALKTIALVAPAIAAVTFVHLPLMVVTACLVTVYGAMSGPNSAARLGGALFTSVGVLLGLALASSFLLPAIALLPFVSTATLWDTRHQPEGHFILALNTLHRSGLLMNSGLLVPIGLAGLFLLGVPLARRGRAQGDPSKRARGSSQDWRQTGGGMIQPIAAALFVAAFMATPLSEPVWRLVTPLRTVMFPGRFLMPASLLAAGLIAVRLPSSRPGLRRFAILSGFSLALAAILLSVRLGDGRSSDAVRTRQALAHHGEAPEYVPATAATHGWVRLAQHGADMQAHAAALVSDCMNRQPHLGRSPAAPLVFQLERCVGPTVVPQFYFPGWTADADGHALAVRADPSSGLVQVDVPAGTRAMTLHRTTLHIERVGLMVNLAALAIWLGLLWTGWGPGQAARTPAINDRTSPESSSA